MISTAIAALLLLQNGKSGLVYSGNTSFFIDAPTGWVMDPGVAQRIGLPVVLYPMGSSWSKADSVMYANLTDKAGAKKDVASVIRDDTAKAKSKYAGPITKEKTLKTQDKRDAVVYRFDGAGKDHKGVERVAYIDLPKSVALLVLSSKTKAGFGKSETSFDAFVQSFAYFGAVKRK